MATFLIEMEAARHYHMPYALIIGWTFRNPLVEHLLPALLQVTALAVLDEALETYISNRTLRMPGRYRRTLEGRSSYLADIGAIENATALHAARDHRNAVAHDIQARLGWDVLSADVEAIEIALKRLGYVRDRPRLEYFGERSGLELSEEPGILGVREFRIGVKEDGFLVYEVSWEQKLHRVGSQQ